MRESPSPVLGGPTSKNRHTSEFSNNQYGTFPGFDSYPSHQNPELEDGSSKSQDRRKHRKKREEKKEEVKRSEDIQDYVGDKKSIDELLEFIDGNHAGVKKSKKLVSKTTEDIPTKANKTKHKNKDKKQKSPTPSNSIEEIETGDISAQIGSLEKESGGNNMGNTGGKTECENPVENGDSVSDETEALSTCNDLLKQDDKINNKSDKNNKNDKKSKSVSNSIISSQTNVIKGDITLDKCEKIKNKESVKSGIKKDTPASVASEKKKAEKQQTKGNNKMERSELPTSKSDDSLVRADTSASMSVKQKNAKNKKSKPQSLQAAKDEGNASSIEGSHKAIDIPAISNEGLIDNNFIFTDLDVPLVPKEDEFRIVSKKKKKITKEIQPTNYINNGNNNNKSFPRFYDDKRSIAPSNGNNKLPQSNIIPTTIESDTRVRDLSPSAFPALCSNERERQSLKDGRRNSTGDVPIPSEVLLKSQDDSDMESVKSLPATQGSRAADPLLSPRLNVSYARMAACPKPEDGYLSPGEKSPEIDTTDNIDRKVWKGSPTERRHSIGSSPEGNVIISTTNSPALKIGSSEAFIVEPMESKSDSTVYVANGPNVHCVQQSKSDEVILGKKEVNLTKENYKIAKQCAIVIPTVQQKSPNSLQDTYYNSNIKNIKHERGTKIPENIEPNLNSINNETFSRSDHISNVNSKQYIQKSVSKPNSSSISSKKVKQQSVIFLDRRLAEAPENLGITFGFEFEPLMNTVASDKKQEKMDSSVISSALEEITSLSEDSNVTFLSDDNENKLIDKDADIVNSSSSSSVICKTPEVSEPVPSLTDDKNNPDFLQKVQSQLGRLNGVLPPPSQGQVMAVTGENPLEDPAIVEVHLPMEKAVENVDADSSDVKVKCSPYNSNGVIVYFGESVATLKKDVVVPSATNGPTRYCGKVTHIPEAGEPNGNFNHADVVAFLNAEWEKIQKLEKREPAAVKVHGMS